MNAKKTLIPLCLLIITMFLSSYTSYLSLAGNAEDVYGDDSSFVNMNKRTLITDSLVTIQMTAPVNGWSEMIEISPFHDYYISVNSGDSLIKQVIDPISGFIFNKEKIEIMICGDSISEYGNLNFWPEYGKCIQYFMIGKDSRALRYRSVGAKPVEFSIGILLPKIEMRKVADGIYIGNENKEGGAKIKIHK